MSVSVSRQRILSLWLARLPTDRLARSHDIGSPAVVYGKRGNAELIVALDETAETLGLGKGLSLTQARAMHPGIAAIEEEPEADARLLARIADGCLRYTPLVALDPPDGLLLDITGCAHLYGGEDKLAADLCRRLDRARMHHRITIAGTIGAAFAAARFGRAGLHASGKERHLVTPLPMAALRLAPEIAAALRRVGLKRIGDIIDLPRAPLAARFGAELLRQLDRMLGQEHEPLNPRLPVAPYLAEQRFAEPIVREDDVLGIVERLASQLKTALERNGDGVRRVELTLFRTDGAVRRIDAGTSRPLRDPLEIRALFIERLAALADEFDPGFGFDMARLSAVVAEPWRDEQAGLRISGRNNRDDELILTRLVDRLSARLGARRVRRLAAQDCHIPELAATTLPAQSARDIEAGWQALRHYHTYNGLGPRPLRLLARPEPVEAIAGVPDGPPVRFRWRRALHEIVAAEGPERIESMWWTEPGDETGNLARDYFRVEDKAGLRFWLFRAGLYRNLKPGTDVPRWFVHGAFG